MAAGSLRRQVEALLLDFHRAPGRFTPAQREPALLFAHIRDVLLIADGRAADEGPPPDPAAIEAARFFVRTALLRVDADHYTVLGLQATASSTQIKERYRMLMRAVHPDFATAGAANPWPSDAATRINRAYEVLSSPKQREAYDEARAPRPPAPQAEARPAPPEPRAAAMGPPRQSGLRWLALGFGGIGLLAGVVFLVPAARDEREVLVQRPFTRAPALARSDAAVIGPAQPASPDLPPADAAPTDNSLPRAWADAMPALFGAPPAAAASAPVTAPAPAAAGVLAVLPPNAVASADLRFAAAPAAPAPIVAQAASANAPATAPIAQPPQPAAPAVAAPVPVPTPAPAAPAASRSPADLTIADIQPQLTQLVQQIESGWGENIIAMLDRAARGAPAAQAFAQQFDSMFEGSRPLKVARAEFRGEMRDSMFVVFGEVTVQPRSPAAARELSLRAQFTLRNGAPALTGLSFAGN